MVVVVVGVVVVVVVGVVVVGCDIGVGMCSLDGMMMLVGQMVGVEVQLKGDVVGLGVEGGQQALIIMISLHKPLGPLNHSHTPEEVARGNDRGNVQDR